MTEPATHTQNSESADIAGPAVAAVDYELFEPQDLALHNALRRPRRILRFALGEKQMTLARCAPSARPASCYVLALDIGDVSVRLELDRPALAALGEELGLACALGDTSTAVGALWLEYALLPVIEPLEQRLRLSIRFRAADDDAPDALVSAGLALKTPNHRFHLTLVPATGSKASLIELIDAFWPIRPNPCAALPLPVRWIAGHQDLSIAQLRSLRPGDAVMLIRPPQGAVVVIADRFVAPAGNEQPELLDAPQPMQSRGGFLMAEPHEDDLVDEPDTEASSEDNIDIATDTESDAETEIDDDAGGLDSKALNALPVRLVCELGRLDMPLGEVRELEQGSVLSLSRPADSAVDIVINGQRLGRGSLVKIGDSLGVRIERLELDG